MQVPTAAVPHVFRALPAVCVGLAVPPYPHKTLLVRCHVSTLFWSRETNWNKIPDFELQPHRLSLSAPRIAALCPG